MSDRSLEERLGILEAQVSALDRLMESRIETARTLAAATDVKIDERFHSQNEFRNQIREERATYVTRVEMGWLISIVIVLVFAVVGLFLKVPR